MRSCSRFCRSNATPPGKMLLQLLQPRSPCNGLFNNLAHQRRAMSSEHSAAEAVAAVESETSGAKRSARKKIVVFGGNGYVGQQVVAAALSRGVNVVSVNRSGAPASFSAPTGIADVAGAATVEWCRGDLLGDAQQWAPALLEADGAISCVGAFGSNEFMERVNGDANISAISAALKAQVPRFVFISTAENNLPDFVLRGYFHGKRRAEQALLDAFPTVTRNGDEVISGGTVLRPGFIYGRREVAKGVKLPLDLIGRPLELVFGTPPLKALRSALPGLQALLAPPIDVQKVGRVAVECAIGDAYNGKDILSISDINAIYRRLTEK